MVPGDPRRGRTDSVNRLAGVLHPGARRGGGWAIAFTALLLATSGLLFPTATAAREPTPPHPATDTLRVVAYNIKHGRGMDGRVDLDRVADVLRRLNPDVVTLQEVDDGAERTGGVDQVAVLAERLAMEGFHGPHRPFQGGFYGNAVLTRLPVLEERTHPIPSTPGSPLTVHEVRVAVGAVRRPVSVVSVHLAGTPERRLAQADSVTRRFRDAGHPVLLAGDFNGRPDGPVVTRLARDWAVLPKAGDPRTYPADAPDREIDFVMLRPVEAFRVLDHRVVAAAVASDHRPLLAVVAVR